MCFKIKNQFMSIKTNKLVFIVLHVLAWIIFVGLCIEAGGLLVNFIFSIYKPEFVHKLYNKLDLSAMYAQSKPVFFGMYGFAVAISFLKAYLFYMVIKLLSKFNLAKPFNNFVSKQITQISYCTFSIGIISFIAKQVAKNMQHYGLDTKLLDAYWVDSQAFILMAAVVFVIAAIFQKGIEIQTENDLTV